MDSIVHGFTKSQTRLSDLKKNKDYMCFILIHGQTTMSVLSMYMWVYIWIFSYVLIFGLHCCCSIASVMSNFLQPYGL